MSNKLLVEKYSPKSLSDLTYNDKVTSLIEKLSKKQNFSHLIFYGPDGAGKKTRIRILLQNIFSESVHKLKIESKEMKINSTMVEYTVASSNHHIELTPADSGNHDRHIVNYVIKESASISNLYSNNFVNNAETSNINNKVDKNSSKVVVIHEADMLSKEAQSSLRRTMEKYMGNCRIIMSCCQLSKIISPIRSRCLSIRVAAPSEEKMKECLNQIKKSENMSVNDLQIKKIIYETGRNLRSAIFQLQLSKFLL
jgi:replication factor C subunit 3/5